MGGYLSIQVPPSLSASLSNAASKADLPDSRSSESAAAAGEIQSSNNVANGLTDNADVSSQDSEESVSFEKVVRLALEDVRRIPGVREGQGLPGYIDAIFDLMEDENTWLVLLVEMVKSLPLNDPHSAILVSTILQFSSLPSMTSVQSLNEVLITHFPNPSDDVQTLSPASLAIMRNTAIVWTILAQRLAGKMSVLAFTGDVRRSIRFMLALHQYPLVRLTAINAMESFLQTGENKVHLPEFEPAILELAQPVAPRQRAEKSNLLGRQIDFLMDWIQRHSQDSSNADPNRAPTLFPRTIRCCFDPTRSTKIWKISADGLELRNDSVFFESFRANRGVSKGKWYYEVELLTDGVMQIGWSTMDCIFNNEEGDGVGDNDNSFAVDGSRGCFWMNGPECTNLPRWNAGDILGASIDFEQKLAIFYLNGQVYGLGIQFMTELQVAFHPAASFTCFQHARFNFGEHSFVYPPPDGFRKLNEPLETVEERQHLDEIRPLVQQFGKSNVQTLTSQWSIASTSPKCTICCDRAPTHKLGPCGHDGFCAQCAETLESCPFCRQKIVDKVEVTQEMEVVVAQPHKEETNA